jgi:hypothetical protein
MVTNGSLRCSGCRGVSHVLGVRAWDKALATDSWIEMLHGVCSSCGRLWSASITTHRNGTMSLSLRSAVLEDVRPRQTFDVPSVYRQLEG